MKGLAEREIIRLVTSRYGSKRGNPMGYDDDVSAIPLSPKTWIVTKTDMLVGSTDVPPGMTLRQAARKAVIATVSDFAAKGVQPKILMVALGLHSPARKETVQSIAHGLNDAAREYKCKIIGGDTSQANDLVIDIMGIGLADPKRLIRRSGAQSGDVVALTGPFGRSSAGLRILLSKSQKDIARFAPLVRSALYPRAQLKQGKILAGSNAVTSSIDSSDGLALSLHELAKASHVRIEIDRIPVDHRVAVYAQEKRIQATDLALYGGEEYEVVFTAKPAKFAQLKQRSPSLIPIGEVVKGKGVISNVSGSTIEIKPRGWEHFESPGPR